MEEWADPKLLTEVRKYGKFDENACLNCGGCTITCDLSSEETVVSPRRSIEYVRTGLKKSLMSRLDPWLCYYCGDCATSCPTTGLEESKQMHATNTTMRNFEFIDRSNILYSYLNECIYNCYLFKITTV